MAFIEYTGINQIVESTNPRASLLDLSIENKIAHLHECGGSGRCTTCRVRVVEGLKNLSPRTTLEHAIAAKRRWDPSIRLACQTFPKGDITIQRLVWSSAEVSKLQLETVPDGVGEERDIAILFCDMRNFTSITAKNLTFDMAHMLNRFFTILGDPILMNNGIIYQYVGDEIIGLFGTGGGTKEKNCIDAVRAGLGMIYAVERLNRIELKDFDVEFKVGIGIHFGQAYLGHIGHPKHKQFCVLGDPVNITSRIQGQTRSTNTNLLISKDLHSHIPSDTLQVGKTPIVNLKGKEEAFQLLEVRGFSKVDVHLEVQATLDYLLQNELDFATKFYDKVFRVAPHLRRLFKSNMTDQARLLTHMLSGIVYSLSRPEYLQLGLRKLGKDHVQYGVTKDLYPVVQKILLETIAEELGDRYSDTVRDAWEIAIGLVIEIMSTWDEA